MKYPVGVGTLLQVAARRPGLLVEALRSLLAFRRRGRIAPSAGYLDWRSHTAYGSSMAVPSHDMAEFLAWRKAMRRGRTGR